VVDATGNVVFELGNTTAAVYPRSAVKPIQAVPLVASGAAESLGLSSAEIALACGSHGGTPSHVTAVRSMLAKAGLDESCLACGGHWPLDEDAARRLAAAGERPSPLHDNCSGKHAGFLCLARHRGHPIAGYVEALHPTMQEVTATLRRFTDEPLTADTMGIDGCSIPTFALPLRSCAVGLARLASGTTLRPEDAAAARRIVAAMTTHPDMVAGPRRFESRVMATYGPAVACKPGAEGVFCAGLSRRGLGVAIKIDDGNGRAAEAVMAVVLAALLAADDQASPDPLVFQADPAIRTRGGMVVGLLGVTPELRAKLADLPT
jgi:L-asparaginase II